jgi:hypothetical protein
MANTLLGLSSEGRLCTIQFGKLIMVSVCSLPSVIKLQVVTVCYQILAELVSIFTVIC